MQFLVSRTGHAGNWERISLQRHIGKSRCLSTREAQSGSCAEQQRDRHRTKRRSIVCTLELLSGDAFTLSVTNDTSITFWMATMTWKAQN